MDRIAYTYTVGMDDDEITTHLEHCNTGILGLADADDAYAIPVSHHYEDGSLYIRLAVAPTSTKKRFLETTDTACYTLSDVDASGNSWSIIISGSLVPLTDSDRDRFDETTINESFLDLRIFDEDVESIDIELHELVIETITGRKSAE